MQSTTRSKRVQCDAQLAVGRNRGDRCRSRARFYQESHRKNYCGAHAQLLDVVPGTGPTWSDETCAKHPDRKAHRTSGGALQCMFCAFDEERAKPPTAICIRCPQVIEVDRLLCDSCQDDVLAHPPVRGAA